MSEVTGTRAVHLRGGKWQRIDAVYFYAFHTWLDKFPDEFVASYASVSVGVRRNDLKKFRGASGSEREIVTVAR